MGDRYKTLFIGIVLVSCSSWAVMEFGPRACGKATQEPDGQAETFAADACRLFLARDEVGFGDLLVRKGDITVDERYGWFPFAGAADEDWEPWTQRALKTTLAAREQLDGDDWKCGKIIDIDRVAKVKDTQGRITTISIEISNGDRTEVLDLGPSVRAKRGRVFHGDKAGLFVRHRDSGDSGGESAAL